VNSEYCIDLTKVSCSLAVRYDVHLRICLNKRIGDMSNSVFAQSISQTGDDEIFHCDVSDAALEKAASAPPGGAMSFPNAPTVSILIICCSFDGP
jgi:hypothetical protein